MTKRAVLFCCLLVLSGQTALAEEWDHLLGFSEESNAITQNKAAKLPKMDFANPSGLQVVKRLDQEILLLRAERSQRNGDVLQVKRYLEQLEKQQILPPFMGRLEQLKKYVAEFMPVAQQSRQYIQSIDFPLEDNDAVVAIVLPTSGDYETAGQAIQNAIQQGLAEAGFKGKLIALDSNLYANAFDLWELLKFYEPDFIFGPLVKEKVAGWRQLRTGVPTLFFNDIAYLGVAEFSLSPNKLAGLEQVFQLLQEHAVERVVVLSDNTAKSQELSQVFSQAWLQGFAAHSLTTHTIEGNVGQNIEQIMGVQGSKNRARWLQNILQVNLDFTARQRQDTQAIVSLVAQESAIQIAPYLTFIAKTSPSLHIWYPSKTPSAEFLSFNRQALQQTYVLLPQSITLDYTQKKPQINLSEKSGLFYALGRVAVEIVKNSTSSTSLDEVANTAYGSYVRNAAGQFHLLPLVYWADKGALQATDISSNIK